MTKSPCWGAHYTWAIPTLSPHPASCRSAPTPLRCATEKTLKKMPDGVQKTRPWHCPCHLLSFLRKIMKTSDMGNAKAVFFAPRPAIFWKFSPLRNEAEWEGSGRRLDVEIALVRPWYSPAFSMAILSFCHLSKNHNKRFRCPNRFSPVYNT